jgi:hypothetical protein
MRAMSLQGWAGSDSIEDKAVGEPTACHVTPDGVDGTKEVRSLSPSRRLTARPHRQGPRPAPVASGC